jgi:hypothetical protein
MNKNTGLVSGLGSPFGGTITKAYRKGTVKRRYVEAIEDGITEEDLQQDLAWMLSEAKSQGEVEVVLKVWRFIMEYTVGKPKEQEPEEDNYEIRVVEALKLGAQYMVELTPPEQIEELDEDEPDTEP